MIAPVQTFSPSNVVIMVAGYRLTGLYSVNFKWNKAPFRMIHGIRGSKTRVANRDTSGTLTLEVAQTSATNDILSQILAGDRNNQSARLEIAIKDTAGTTRLTTTRSYIRAYPELNFSGEAQSRLWEIDVLEWSSGRVGGNAGTAFNIIEGLRDGVSPDFS